MPHTTTMPNRTPQPLGKKGSLKWMQVMVNDHPHLLSAAIGAVIGMSPASIEWVSPLASDVYAEYSDQGFLDRLGITLKDYPLKALWPARGPQWDHGQYVYVLRCRTCGHEYGANGSDIWLRRCLNHDRGAPGLSY